MSYWQLRCAEMKQRSAYLYQSGLWSDCSFKLGEEEVIVKAHKLIMAMASPVFGKLFYGKEAAKSPVPIYDTRPEVFRILLEYIYSDHINLTNLRDACDLHNAAFKWRLPYVKEMCIKFISSSLNADNVFCIYELASQSKELHLQNDCIKIFKTLTREILKAESFKEAKLPTLLKIFSMDTLNIDSELDLFKAAVNHATAQEVEDEDEGLKRTHSEDCFTPPEGLSSAKRSRIESTELDSAVEIETNIDTTSDTPAVNLSAGSSRKESHYVSEHDYAGESSREHGMTTESYIDYEETLLKAKIKASRREKYRDLMHKIRFLTLTPQEFAECTTLSFLLPSSAILALSLNISSKDTFVPMPKHFSTSMVPRNLSQHNERERQAGTTRITVNNIRNLKKFESIPFYIRNLAWTLMLMRLQETVEDINRDILIIAVTCFFENGVPEWIEKVEVRASFNSENYIGNRFQDMKLKLSQPCNDYGAWINKTEWSDFISSYGIIEDNAVTCKVYVSTNIQKSPTSPDSSPDNTQTDYITTPLRSSTPVSRARYLKEETQKRSDLTASGLAETRSRTPLLSEKRCTTPLLPEMRSLTPLLPEKCSLTPLLPEKRSLTPLLAEKCSVPSQLIEKRSVTPVLPERRSVTPSQLTEKRSLTPVLTDKRQPPVLPEKHSGSPLIEKNSFAKTPVKRNLSPLPEERNIITPPVENRILPPRPKKRFLTQSPTEKLTGSPDKSSFTSPLKTSNPPIKNGANSSPLPPNNNATPSLPEKHVSKPTSLPINTKSPLTSQATLTQSIPASMSSPSLPEIDMRAKQNGNNTVRSPQTLNSPVDGPINRNSSDPSIETLKLSVSNKDKPRALACVQILRSLHRTGYPMNGSIAQRYLNELSAMSINGFQVLRPLLAYANASAATNGSGHIIPAIMDKNREVLSPMNNANSASRLIDDNNTNESVTKPDQKENEPLISELIPRKDNVASVSESMAIIDDNNVIFNPPAPTDCTYSTNEQNMKHLAPKDLALKDDGPSTSKQVPIKDNVSSVSEPMAIPEDITAISNSLAAVNCTDSMNEQNMKQPAPKPLALKDVGQWISEPIGLKDTVSSVSETMALTDDVKVISNPSALMDTADSINDKNMEQLASKPLALKDDGLSISEPIVTKDTVSSVSESMAIIDDSNEISKPSVLTDCTDSINENTKQLVPKPFALKDDRPSTSESIPMKDTVFSVLEPIALTSDIKIISALTDSISDNNIRQQSHLALKHDEPSISESNPIKDTVSSVSEPMVLTDDIEVISSSSAPMDCTNSINEQNMKQIAPKPPTLKNYPSVSEPIPLKESVSALSETMALNDDVRVISHPSALIDGTDSIIENTKQLVPEPLALKDNGPSISEPIIMKDTVTSVTEPMVLADDVKAMSCPSPLVDCTDSINENNMKQQEPIPIRDTSYSVSESMAITDDITRISSPSTLKDCTDSSNGQNIKQLAFKHHAPGDNELSISEPIPIKDSSVIEPLTTTDDLNSVFKPSIIAASTILDLFPLESLDSLHSKVSNNETSTEEVHLKSPVPVIVEPIPLNDSVSSSEPMVLTDDTSAVLADEKNKEQLASNPSVLKENEPLILEPMCLKEAKDTNSVSELSSINNTPNVPNQMSEKSELELTTMDRTNTVLEQSTDAKNKEQTTLKSLALRAIPFVSDPIPTAPQSLDSNNNSSSISVSMSLKFDDSETFDLIESADSSLKRDCIENPLDIKKHTASSNSKPLADDNISSASKPMDLMESVDIHPESHNVQAKLTHGDTDPSKSQSLALNDTILLDEKPVAVPLVLNDNLSSANTNLDLTFGDTEPSKSEPLALNDTILLKPTPAAVPLVSNPVVFDDNISSASKPMDLMEIFHTISELHTLEAQLTLGDTEPSKSEPLAVNECIILELKPAAVPLVTDPLVVNDNLSPASKLMDLMESGDIHPEPHTVEAELTLGVTEPLKSAPLVLNDTIILELKPAAVPLMTDPLVVNDNLSSASKLMGLMESGDIHPEPHTVDAKLTLGDTIPLKSAPLVLNDTIILEPKPAAVPLVTDPLVLNDNLSSASKPMDLMEIFDTISELHTLEAQLTLGDTVSSKSKPLSLNDNIHSDSKTVAAPLVSNPMVLNDNVSSTSKPMDLMEIFDTISELNTLEAQLGDTVSSTAPNSLSVSDPLALSDTIPSVSNTLALNDNHSSASEPIYLKDSVDANLESHSVDSRLIFGDTEPSKSVPLAPIHNIPSESKPVVLKDNGTTSEPLVLKDNVTTLSKPLVFNENVPSTLDSSTSNANSASEPMDITDSNIEPLTEVSLTESDIACMMPETMELEENSPRVLKYTQPSNSGITCISAFDDKDTLSTSEAILKCRRNLMTLKHLKYPMSGILAQKYLKTLKELTDKTNNFDPKSKPSSLINKALMSAEAKVDESKQTSILINRQILMSLKSLKYPMSGTIAQKHLKALIDLTNKTQQPMPHLKSTEISRLKPRSKENSAASPMSEMKKPFIIRKIIKYRRALMTLKFHKYPMTGFMAQKYIKAIDDLKKKIDL